MGDLKSLIENDYYYKLQLKIDGLSNLVAAKDKISGRRAGTLLDEVIYQYISQIATAMDNVRYAYNRTKVIAPLVKCRKLMIEDHMDVKAVDKILEDSLEKIKENPKDF